MNSVADMLAGLSDQKRKQEKALWDEFMHQEASKSRQLLMCMKQEIENNVTENNDENPDES